MQARLKSLPILLVPAIILSLCGQAFAQRMTLDYSRPQRPIRACVLLPSGGGINPNAYLFLSLIRASAKPHGWDFINPLAGPLDKATCDRWTTDPNHGPNAGANYWTAGPGAGIAIGSPLPKHLPAYWEVELNDANAKRLDQFDVIYICWSELSLSTTDPALADGLKRAALRGALIWVDNHLITAGGAAAGTSVTNFEPPVGRIPGQGVSQVAFQFTNPANNASNLLPVDNTHPIFNTPLPMNAASVNALGATTNLRSTIDRTSGAITNILGAHDLQPLVCYANGSGAPNPLAPNVCVASIGDGGMLVTSNDCGYDIQQWTLAGASDPDASTQLPDLQLAYNAIAWAGGWSQTRAVPSGRAFSARATATGPLDILWQYPGPTEPNGTGAGQNEIGWVVSSPVVDGDYVYAVSLTSQNGVAPQLLCLRVVPQSTGTTNGQPYNLMWRQNLPGTPRWSSPTVATINMPLGSGGADVPVRCVLVSTVPASGTAASGQVTCYAAQGSNAINSIAGGTVLWQYNATSYSADASGVNPSSAVVDLSTPVVSNGYVFVLASEYSSGLASGVNGTYGRVHVFDARTGGQVPNHTIGYAASGLNLPSQGYRYVYPDPDLDQNGTLDAGGAGTPILPPNYAPPDRRLLPCFHDPNWVSNPASELPPEPTPVPAVTSAAEGPNGVAAEAVVMFGTSVSIVDPGGVFQVSTSTGGSDYALVPTPYNSAAPNGVSYTLNSNYYCVRSTAPATATATRVDSVPFGTASQTASVAGTDGNTYIVFQNIQAVRALLDTPWTGTTSSYSDPLLRQTGMPITLTDGTTTYNASLPGPMRWQYAHGTSLSAATHKAVDGPVVVSSVFAVGTTGGAVDGLDASSGTPRWVFNPAGGTDYSRASSPAASSGTAYAALAMNRGSDVHGEVYGLKTQPTLTVQLGPTPANAAADACSIQPGSVSIALVDGSATITPQLDDKVDYRGRFITFGAANSRLVAGKAILVSYGLETSAGAGVFTNVTNEPHVVPAIATFAYVPGYIKLKRNPVQNATVSITTPDGTPVDSTSISYPEATVTFANVNNCVPDGWVDLRAATVTDGAGAHALPPGQEVIVQYKGWNEDLGGWESVPDAGRNVLAERQQVPVYFGPAISSPAVAANSLFVGTEGYRGGGATIISPLDANAWPWPMARNETMLSIDVNPATGAGSGNRVAPVVPESSSYSSTLVPVVSSSPTVSGDNVLVGSRCVAASSPDQLAPTTGKFGFVSALGSRTTLVCDNTRVMEVRQGQPWWVCLGTRSARADQDPQATGTAQTLVPQSFNRPAKATKLGLDTIIPLGTGNHYLVCDTGNDRVVEIDELGNVVWPLDVGNKNGTLIPVDYWTSPDYSSTDGRPNPTKAHLSRPADVWRYVTTWEDYYNNATGAVGPDGTPEVTWHTVIADAGNARVIDIATVRLPLSATNPTIVQKHRLRVLSPTQARLASNPSQIARIEYTSAQPIFDPRDSQNCIGYLCVASNLNQLVILDNYSRTLNPVRSLNIWHNTYDANGVGTPSRDASANWQYWCWLYTIYDNATAAWVVNPLAFSNIRHAEYSTVGTRQYVTIAASHYLGRMNPLTPAPLTDATNGAGVFDFAMNVDPSDKSGNSWARVAPTTPSPDDPVWYFNQNDYVSTNAYRVAYFTLASGQTINKVLDPWCAKRLADGRHLITTMAPLVEHFTHRNAPGLSGTSLGSEVFEVVTRITDGLGNLVPPATGDLNPTLYQKLVDTRSIVPDPRAVDWADPLSQPAYAERY